MLGSGGLQRYLVWATLSTWSTYVCVPQRSSLVSDLESMADGRVRQKGGFIRLS